MYPILFGESLMNISTSYDFHHSIRPGYEKGS